MIQPGKLCGFDLTIEDPGIVVCTFNEPERLNGMTGALKRAPPCSLRITSVAATVFFRLRCGNGLAPRRR